MSDDRGDHPSPHSPEALAAAEAGRMLPLVFEAPKGRGKPPAHLADFTAAERKARLEELGLPGFRAKQLSNHYFARLVDDPAEMTDLPAGQRDELVAGLMPSLMDAVRTMEADRGTTRK
ncbi:MAG: 23S rRNA (adenine(2503)-C(2))-methyltransferase RlmN, partial [Myxococcales bacterium]